jgi:hypothetical protein
VKNKIDDWFSVNNTKIKSIIGYWRNYHNKNYNINDMYSDVYIHVVNNIDKISNISELEAITFNYIKDNTYWSLSKINKDYKTDKEFLTQSRSEVDFIDEKDNLEDKIKLELRINYLYEFRNTLTDIEERIYFTKWIEILQDGEKPSTRRMKDEFDIKHYQSAELSKALLSKLNDFLIKNNYK